MFSSSDDKAPVTDTNIPSHLEQMLEILTQEERERESGETGPCMEYLLHHKILETLYTLGKADVRPSLMCLHTGVRRITFPFLCKNNGKEHVGYFNTVHSLLDECGILRKFHICMIVVISVRLE